MKISLRGGGGKEVTKLRRWDGDRYGSNEIVVEMMKRRIWSEWY